MSDYNANVYEEQGGDALVFKDGGEMRWDPQTETTSANLDRGGVSVLASTQTNKLYTLDTPAAGVQKVLVIQAATTTNDIFVDAQSGVTFASTAAANRYLRISGQQVVTLYAESTSRWAWQGSTAITAVTTSAT